MELRTSTSRAPVHEPRLERLRETLARQDLAAALVLHAVDLYYFTGTRQNGALLVRAEGAPVLLVRKSLARARTESEVEVRPFPASKELAATLGVSGAVGITLDVVPAAIAQWWQKQLPGVELQDVSQAIREQRSVKDEGELERMRDGGRRIAAVMAEIPSFLRAGLREVDVSAEIEARLRRAGNEGSPRLRGFNLELFGGLVVAGDSAAQPGYFDGPVVGRGLGAAYPQGASTREIRAGEPVLCDFTSVFSGYVLDMTRVFAIGSLPAELTRAQAVALRIQDEVARDLRPGVVCQDLWQRALGIAEEAGLGSVFMGPPGDQARFVGHGVGLELDELPVLAPGFRATLQANQTVAVEPKFVFPGLGAVGVENTWVVTEQGGEKLTASRDDVVVV